MEEGKEMTKPEICKNFLKVAYAHFRNEKKAWNIDSAWYNYKSTEAGIRRTLIDGKIYFIVAICGSNDIADWILNFFILSWKGFKFSGWMEAKRIYKIIKELNTFNQPLIIATHSKSGPTGWALYHLCKKAGIEIDSIHAFAPAKGLRKHMNIPEATMYIDKSDPVPKASISLNHPNCKIIYHPEKDGKSIDFSDHSLNHWDGVV
jgi:hypothetical protein